jgi:predicted transcriptional regulator
VTHLSIELPDELAAALARVAGDLGSTLEALLRDAAASIVEEEHDRLERIRQGRADAAAGRTVRARGLIPLFVRHATSAGG